MTATVSTKRPKHGKHILFVRGKDANSNWGAFSAIFLSITGPGQPVADGDPAIGNDR